MNIKAFLGNKLASFLKPFLEDKKTGSCDVIEISKDGKIKKVAFSLLPDKNITEKEAKELLKFSFQRGLDFKLTSAAKNGNGKYALDGMSLTPAIYGMDVLANRDIIYSFYAKHGFIGWQACGMLSQHWLINRCCRIPNEDALSCGYVLHLDNNKDLTDEQKKQNVELLKGLESLGVKTYKVNEKLLKWGFNRSVYGIALAYFVIDGEDPATPLNIDGIKPKSFKGIAIVEPYWASPLFEGTTVTTPGSPNFYKPQYYNIGGQKVHISRLCVKVFSEVPDILKSSYYYGGLPATQMLYERVYAAEKVANEAPELALSKRTFILRTNMEQALVEPEEFNKRITFMTRMHNNNGIWAIDRAENQENVEQLETTLSGLDTLTAEMFKYAAAVVGIPDNRLYAKSINGMASTGENEIKNYSQTLKTYQENCFDDFLIKAYQIIAKSEMQKDLELSITFNPIDTPTAAEKAATQAQKAATYAQLAGLGAISPQEVRQALKNDEDSGFNDIDAELPEELDLEGLTQEAPESGDDTPGNGGNNNGNGSLPFAKAQKAQDEWEEGKHPRKDDGKFSPKGQGGSEKKEEIKTELPTENKTKTNPIKKAIGKAEIEFHGKKVIVDVYKIADFKEFDEKLKNTKPVKATSLKNKEEALNAMLKYAHKNLTNEETGIKAQVNSTQRGELTSNRSVKNSLLNGFTREQHYGAAAKIDELYSKGVFFIDRQDGDKQPGMYIQKFATPIEIDGKPAYADLTVKERYFSDKDKGHSVYSVELTGLENIKGSIRTFDSIDIKNEGLKPIIDKYPFLRAAAHCFNPCK